MLGVSAQMHGVVYLRATLDRAFMANGLDSVTEMAVTDDSATVSNMVGIIGTEAGLNVQLAARKVQWCVSPIYVLPTGCQPFPVTVFFLLASISSTRQMHRSSWRRTYTVSPWCAMPLLTLRRPRGVYFPSLQHTHSLKTTRGFKPSPCMHRAHSTILRCPKTDPARAGYKLCSQS